MTCQRCNSKRILSFSAHCRDCFSCDLDRVEYHGYVPEDFMPFGCGDDLSMEVCLDCGQVQGQFPHRKIREIEPDLDSITVEMMLEYSKMNHKCEYCKELIHELEYDSSPGERTDYFKKYFFSHQIERHNENGLF